MDNKLIMTIGNKSRKMRASKICYINFPTEKITDFRVLKIYSAEFRKVYSIFWSTQSALN